MSVAIRNDKYIIVGANLRGENAWDYSLPLESWSDIVCEPSNIGWFPWKDDEEFDG